MSKIFYDRKDLMVGSLIGLAMGPFAIGPLYDSLGLWSRLKMPGVDLTILGFTCCLYVVGRSALDSISDLVEWRSTPGLFGKPIVVNPSAAGHPKNRGKVVLLMAEAVIFGGGAIVHVVFNLARPGVLLETAATFGQFAIMIGGLTFYERNLALLYPFHFTDWLGIGTR